MATVYRLGASGDVHAAIVSGDPDDPASPAACHFDKGGEWSPDKPDGPECYRCFGALAAVASASPSAATGHFVRRLKRQHVAVGGGAGALTLIGALLAGQGGPVPVAASPSPTIFGGVSTPSVSAWPETMTPGPSSSPVASTAPTPYIPAPSWEPRPSSRPPAPSPSMPEPTSWPTPAPTCLHPGEHRGVDACTWPHNP